MKQLPQIVKPPLPHTPSTMQVSVLSEQAVTPKQNVQDVIIPFEPTFDQDDGIADFDLLSAICDIEDAQNKENKIEIPAPASVVNTCTSNVVNQIPKSFFANCSIGTININIIKK